MKKKITIILLCCCISQAKAQNATHKNTSLDSLYQNYMGTEAPLFSGTIYVDYAHTISGNLPFWNGTRDFVKGNIFFNNILYKDVPVAYDVYKDKLLIQHPVNYKIFEAQPAATHYFELSGKRFVALTASENGMRPGFYELTYSGEKSAVYTKHIKELAQDLSENTTKYHFQNSTLNYVYREGGFFKVTNLKSLLQAYQGDGVKNFVKSNKLDTKKDLAEALKAVAGYHDQSQ